MNRDSSTSPRVLKELSDVIASPLTQIFRKSLTTGQVPQAWRCANVTPVFKKGPKYLCANYRPISLTSIASKLMEHIICSSIMNHADRHNILYFLQHGFRPQRSCETVTGHDKRYFEQYPAKTPKRPVYA